MGNFDITIKAVGGHGCDRTRGDGEQVYGCQQSNCVDCLTVSFAQQLAHAGATLSSATLTHWPGTKDEVVDTIHLAGMHGVNRAHRTRAGEFAEAKSARAERAAKAKAEAEAAAAMAAVEAEAAKVRAEADARARAEQAEAAKRAFDDAVAAAVAKDRAERETQTIAAEDVGEMPIEAIEQS